MVQFHAPVPLYVGKEPPVPFEEEAVWSSESVCDSLEKRENSLPVSGMEP